MSTKKLGTSVTADATAGWLDARIDSSNSGINYSSADRFNLDVGGTPERVLFHLPDIVSALVANATVNSATLTFYRLNAGGSGSVSLYRLKKTPTINQATWINQSSGTPWETPGALGATDYDSTVLATGTCTAGAGTTFTMSGAGFNSLIQGWLDGSITNNGFVIAATTGLTAESDIASAERATDAQRPYLTVDYTPVAPPSASGADVLCTKHDGTTTITVTLSEAAPVGGCSVDYATQDSTAIAGQHYTGKTGTMTFAQGEQSKSETITIAP